MVRVKEVTKNGELSFSTVCTFMDCVQRYNRNPYMRNKTVAAFIGHCIKKDAPDAYEVFRLVLPQTDQRVYPGISQHRLVYLVTVVVRRLIDRFPRLGDVVGRVGAGGEDGRGDQEGNFYARLFMWQDKDALALALGEPRELSEYLKEKVYDVFCGDLSMPDAAEGMAVQMDRQPSPTVSEVNAKLDEFADASARYCIEDQADIMTWFMEKLTSRQMMWLTQIVLKRVRVWIKEQDVLEHAPWGEGAVAKFFEQGQSFQGILQAVGGGGPGHPEGASLGWSGEVQNEDGEKARPARQAHVVMRDIDNAFMYMERRFKPGNYSPMSVIVDAAFDGIKVRIRRVGGEVRVEFSDDEKKKGMVVCQGTVLSDVMATLVLGGDDRGRPDNVDMDIEADIVAWNSAKGCAEPRFILEALIDADQKLEGGVDVSSDSQPSHSVVKEHLELLVLVSDIVSYGDELMVIQKLMVRQETLGYVPNRRWGAEQGFRVPVRVLPLVPGSTQIAGVSISKVYENVGDIKAFRDTAERVGARGVTLRAPEAEWNTAEKMARVMVLNSSGLSIVNCAIIGYWRERNDGVEGRVSHWLLGVAGKGSGQHELSAILKLRNHLHITDEKAALRRLGSHVARFPDPTTGMFPCDQAAMQASNEYALVAVAGNLLSPGKWSSSPLVLTPTLLGLPPSGSVMSSMEDISRMIEAKRAEKPREKMPSARLKDRRVADRFVPCHKPKSSGPTGAGPLRDYNVCFINYSVDFVDTTTRFRDKKRCEELVEMLGGVVSQNYCQGVNLLIAGQPTFVTNKFRTMDIDIMTVTWLEKVARLMDGERPPTELPGFLPEDYLPEWDPEDARRKKINKNFFELFSADGGNDNHMRDVHDTTGAFRDAKRIKTSVNSPPTSTASAARRLQKDAPPPLVQTRPQTPPGDVSMTSGNVSEPVQLQTQATLPAPSAPVPQAKPPGSSPIPRHTEPSPQATSTRSPMKSPMTLKERAAAVGAKAAQAAQEAPSQPTGTGPPPVPDRPKATKESLRDRAKRLGLGKK